MDYLLGFILLLIRIAVTGAAWSLPVRFSPDQSASEIRLRFAARALLTGLVLTLLPALALLSLDLWTPHADLTMWLLVLATGVVRAWRHLRADRDQLRAAGFAVLLAAVTGGVAMLLPLRSEWLAGGWDPGIYQLNAVAMAHHGGLAPRGTIYGLMTPDEMALFLRSGEDYHEVFPSVPIDPETGATSLYFFHLTPLFGAILFRAGGLELLMRLPMLFAFWGLIPLLGLAAACGLRGWRPWALAATVLTAPLWWYHQAIPSSEMLYLVLLGGAVLLYFEAWLTSCRMPLVLWAVLALAVVNHFNFPVLAVILLGVAAVAEAVTDRPGRLVRLAGCYAAIAAGMAWDIQYAAITILRLDEKDAVLGTVVRVFAIGAAAGLAMAWLPLVRSGCNWLRAAARVAVGAGGAILFVLAMLFAFEPARGASLEALSGWPMAAESVERLFRLMHFNGWGWMMVGGAGFAMLGLCARDDRRNVPLLVAALALGLVFAAFVINPGIAPIYPWALRRYVVVMSLLFAIGQGALLVALFDRRHTLPRAVRAVGLLLMIAGLGQGAMINRDAARIGDYRGMALAVERIGGLLKPDDIVIADDPRWGTPLMLMMDLDVVSGRRLWRSKDPAFRARFLGVLDRIRRDTGRRVVWLTSTRDGMGIYKMETGPTDPLAEPWGFQYESIMHSYRAKSFAAETKHKTFGLYTWQGDPVGAATSTENSLPNPDRL